VFVGLLFGWYIWQLPRLLFGMLFVSWLGSVLENCFISCCKFSHLFIFLIFQRPADTATFGNNNNNNKHHGQKLTFKSSLSFTKATSLLPKEIYVSRDSGEALGLVGYYDMSTCSS
jgi:hypothetical protein